MESQHIGWAAATLRAVLCVLATLPLCVQGSSVTFDHDADGRVTKATYNDGTIVEYAYDANGNRTSTTVTPGVDTTPPSVPLGLTAAVTSHTQVNLSWSSSTDNVAVTGYSLERCTGEGCSAFLEIATPTSTVYSDIGRSPNTTYTYRVRAHDAAGNQSAFSASVSATTPDSTAPGAPGSPTFSNITMVSARASWGAATDDVAVTAYEYRLNSGSWLPLGSVLWVDITGLSAGTSYSFEVRAKDAANNVGVAKSGTFTTIDTAAPSAPGTPEFNNVTMTSAAVSWGAASDNVAVTGYQYRLNAGNWSPIVNVSSVALTGLSAATTYTFEVRATDAANNFGSASSAVFTTLDTAAPSVPTGLFISAPNSSTVNLSWNASSDNVAVAGYTIFRSGAQIGTSATASYSDNTVSGTTTYSYRVSAYDAAGNNSAQSNAVGVTTPDTIAPAAPSGLIASAVSATQVNLSWNAVTDAGGSGVDGYRVYRNGVHIVTVGSSNHSDISVSGATAYSYIVTAFDRAGNVSAQSNTASVTTPTPIPTTPTLTAQPGSNSSMFSVHWSVPSGPIAYYELEVNANWQGPIIQTYYPPTTSKNFVSGDADWQIRVRACFSSSQCSAWSVPVDYHTCPVSGCP